MNIFILDPSPYTAATYLHDKHIVKMGLEATQIAVAALYLNNPTIYHNQSNILYKPTHINHPWVSWAAQSDEHIYTIIYWGLGIFEEYTYRYARQHASKKVLMNVRNLLGPLSKPAPLDNTTPLCMPEVYQNNSDLVSCYRDYYANEKVSATSTWKHRPKPPWLEDY